MFWLTGYEMNGVNPDIAYADFFRHAPAINSRAELIKGSVCDVKVEEIEDPLMQKFRWLDRRWTNLPMVNRWKKIKR